MKKTLTFFTAIFLSVALFAQPDYTINNNRGPGNLLATQNTPVTQLVLLQNPVRGAINFQITNPSNTRYEISLYATNGQKISSILYDHPAGISVKTMYIPNGTKGIYYLVVRRQGERQSIKVLIE